MLKINLTLVSLLLTGILSLPFDIAYSHNITIIKFNFIDTIKYYTVKSSYYNPKIGQTDNTPLITACNAIIDTIKLKNKQIKWIAVSRNLLKQFPMKSKVYIESSNCEIEGVYYVMDKMNKRFKNQIDILTMNKLSIKDSIKIYKI